MVYIWLYISLLLFPPVLATLCRMKFSTASQPKASHWNSYNSYSCYEYQHAWKHPQTTCPYLCYILQHLPFSTEFMATSALAYCTVQPNIHHFNPRNLRMELVALPFPNLSVLYFDFVFINVFSKSIYYILYSGSLDEDVESERAGWVWNGSASDDRDDTGNKWFTPFVNMDMCKIEGVDEYEQVSAETSLSATPNDAKWIWTLTFRANSTPSNPRKASMNVYVYTSAAATTNNKDNRTGNMLLAFADKLVLWRAAVKGAWEGLICCLHWMDRLNLEHVWKNDDSFPDACWHIGGP